MRMGYSTTGMASVGAQRCCALALATIPNFALNFFGLACPITTPVYRTGHTSFCRTARPLSDIHADFQENIRRVRQPRSFIGQTLFSSPSPLRMEGFREGMLLRMFPSSTTKSLLVLENSRNIRKKRAFSHP